MLVMTGPIWHSNMVTWSNIFIKHKHIVFFYSVHLINKSQQGNTWSCTLDARSQSGFITVQGDTDRLQQHNVALPVPWGAAFSWWVCMSAVISPCALITSVIQSTFQRQKVKVTNTITLQNGTENYINISPLPLLFATCPTNGFTDPF